jgi:hypothetical protein
MRFSLLVSLLLSFLVLSLLKISGVPGLWYDFRTYLACCLWFSVVTGMLYVIRKRRQACVGVKRKLDMRKLDTVQFLL